MAQNNTAEQMEMAFMQEGGLKDDGAVTDPVSGNEVPSGSMDQEVRDDVPAMLSEGEYVVPADVVRFHGVKLFEDLRIQAKMGMAKMEAEGRIGGEPIDGEDMEDDDELPFDVTELRVIETPVREMAEGGDVGEVGPTFTYNPNTRYMERQRTTSGFEMRVYVDPATGRQITIPFFNGQPMSTIPQGFVLASDQAAAQKTLSEQEMQQMQQDPASKRFFLPPDPKEVKRGFDAFTAEDWNNYVKQADGQLAAFTANIPILGTLQRLSESSAKAYAERALKTGVHPATNKALTPQEVTALKSVLNSSITERKSILESIGDLFKGEPDQNMSPRPDFKPITAAQMPQANVMTEESPTMSAIMAGFNKDKSGDTVGQQFASRADVVSDVTPLAAGPVNITDPTLSILLDEASVSSLDDIKNSGSIARREAFDGDSALRTNAEGETIFKAYKDSEGYWTVGPGILLGTVDKKGNQTVSEEAIQKDYTEEFVKDEFVKSLNEATNYIDNKYNADLMPPLARATLINMRFQLGNRFETFTQLDRAIKEGNFTEAAKQVLGNYKVGDKFAFSTDSGAESIGPTLYATQTTNRARRHATRFDLVASQYGKLTPATPPRPDRFGADVPAPPSFIQGMDAVPEGGAAIPYTTDAAGFAGDIPPPVASPVAPVSGGSIPTMEYIESMLSGANIDTSIAPNVRDLIRRQRGVPPIATEGGFPPEVNIQAPSIQTAPQLGQTSKPIQTAPQLGQAQTDITTSTKAPKLPKEPKISDSQFTLGQVSPPSMSLEVPQLELPKFESLPSVDKTAPKSIEDFEPLGESKLPRGFGPTTRRVLGSQGGAKPVEKDKTVSETKKDQSINKNPENTSFTSAASNDDIIQKTARKSDIGDTNVQIRLAKILYAKNQAKNAGVDITFKDSDFDKQGFFKPKSKELQKYKAKGLSSTGFDPLANKKATGGLIDRRAKKKKKT
tara:strand:+ start:1519 stop:4395 length:2877 start_codon:yes stop_codon:yes gene_type:complete